MDKEALNFRMPKECCMTCSFSYHNTYGDCCCKHLLHWDTVDYGGICDLYVNDNTISSVVDDIVDEPNTDNSDVQEMEEGPVMRSCTRCKHATIIKDSPICTVDDKLIEDVNGACSAFELDIASLCCISCKHYDFRYNACILMGECTHELKEPNHG
jgi:hypothetical protein